MTTAHHRNSALPPGMCSRLYDPLTYRHPRTIDEMEGWPFGWWTSGTAAEANEQRLREQLGGAPTSRKAAVVAAAVVLALWFLLSLMGGQ